MSGSEWWVLDMEARLLVGDGETLPLDHYDINAHGEPTAAFSGTRRFVRDEDGLFIEAALNTRPGVRPLRVVTSRSTVTRDALKRPRY